MTAPLIGSAKGTNTATAPTHQAGDLMLVDASRNNSNTAPTLPAGFGSVGTITGSTNSMRVGYKKCKSASETVGTWTNATEVVVHIYRPSAGNICEIGASKGTTGTVTPASYAGLTLVDQTGNSTIVCFGQAKGNATTIEGPPTGTTLREDNVATGELCSFDTNGGVSSWSTQTVSYTGTATTWKTFTVEILDIPTAVQNNIIQRISFQPNMIASTNEPGDNYSFNLPNKSLPGNGLYCCVAYPSGATPVITDDKGNTWPASGAAGTVTADGGAGAIALQIFILASAITDTLRITVSFGGSPQQPVKPWGGELFGITGTINGSKTGTNLNTNGVVSPGAFTPTNNNANGGNLILAFMAENSQSGGTTNPVRIWANSGYTLLDADISWNPGTGFPAASQALLQTAAASTTPMFTVNGSADTFNVVAVALSVGVQGTPKPSGPSNPPHVDAIHYFSTNSNPAIHTMQIPSLGNLGVLLTPSENGIGGVKTASDGEGLTWTKKQTNTDQPTIFYRPGYSPNASRTIDVACSTTAGILMWRYFDVSNCDADSFDTYVGVDQTAANGVDSIAAQPTITPGGQNRLIIAVGGNGLGPTTNVTVPVGAIFDEIQYETAQLTASIATGTPPRADVTAIAWGQLAFGGSGILTGTTVGKGQALQTTNTGTGVGGTGTYDVTISQTVTSRTMKLSSSDSSNMNYGSSLAHFYNNGSTSAESWTWDIANQTANTVWSAAIAFKAPLPKRPLVILQAVKRAAYW